MRKDLLELTNRTVTVSVQQPNDTTQSVTKGDYVMKNKIHLYLDENGYNTLTDKCARMKCTTEEFFSNIIQENNVLLLPSEHFNLLATAFKKYDVSSERSPEVTAARESLIKLNTAFKSVLSKAKHNTVAKSINKKGLISHCVDLEFSEEDYKKLFEKCHNTKISPLSLLERCIYADYIVADTEADELLLSMALYSEATDNPSANNLKSIHAEIDKQVAYLNEILTKISCKKKK